MPVLLIFHMSFPSQNDAQALLYESGDVSVKIARSYSEYPDTSQIERFWPIAEF